METIKPEVASTSLIILGELQLATWLGLGAWSLYFWWQEFHARRRHTMNTLSNATTRPIHSLGLVDIFFTVLIASSANAILLTFFRDKAAASLLSKIVELSCYLLIFVALAFRDVEFRNWFVIKRESLGNELAHGARAFVMVTPWILLISSLVAYLKPYRHDTLVNIATASSWIAILRYWIEATFLTAVTEEFFFRGLLLAWFVGFYPPKLLARSSGGFEALIIGDMKRKIDRTSSLESNRDDAHAAWFAILLTSLIFGLAHWGQGLAPIPLFLFSIFMGWLFLKTKSLWACITTHFLFNCHSLFWWTLEQRMT